MEAGLRFGIGERISAVGIIIGLFGLVAGVSYPLAFPDADPAIARYCFEISAVIIGASILFFVSDLALYLLRRVGIPLGTALAIIGTAFIVIGAIVGLIGAMKTDHPSAAQNKESEHPIGPDITARFVYPDYPALVLVNNSNKLAKEIKWSVAVWNLDDPRTYLNKNPTANGHDPLPVPVSLFDFIRPHSEGGPQALFGSEHVRPYVKEGQRVFGCVGIICPECVRGHTYLVYWVVGKGGWYTEVAKMNPYGDITEGQLVIPPNFTRDLVQAYFQNALQQIPEASRIQIR